MVIVFKKSLLKSAAAKKFVREAKLHYFQEKILEHLDRLEKKEKEQEEAVQKALNKAGLPVGTVRDWGGKKYMKTAPGEWRRKYDSDSRGAKQSIAVIKRKVDACKTSEELLQLVLEHSDRFRDKNGYPLPFVQELSEYVSKANDRLERINDSNAAKIFGPNYKKFKGTGKAAIEKLIKKKKGYVKAAFSKDGIGDIDVVYGKVTDAKHHDGYGLAHILDKHPDITPDIIATTIETGEIQPRDGGFNIVLETSRGTCKVGIEKNFKQKEKILVNNNWVITAFEKRASSWKSRQRRHQEFSKQSDIIGLQNQLDKPNVSQTNSAVKQKTQEKKGAAGNKRNKD